MTLLGQIPNEDIGNADFDEKKATYSQSTYQITSGICGYTTWGPNEIDDRQQQLARLAVETWPLLAK